MSIGLGSHTSVVLSDGSILIMGGMEIDIPLYSSDVWKSSNGGEKWVRITESAWGSTGNASVDLKLWFSKKYSFVCRF